MRSLLVLLAVAVQPALAQARWEYRTLSRSQVEALAGKAAENRLEAGLNKLGADGWELSAIEPYTSMGPGVSQPAQYVFKRPAARAAAPAAKKGAAEEVQLIRLKYANAAEVAKTLSAVFRKGEGATVVADERTNALILQAAEEKLREMRTLIAELDSEEAPKKK
jgi:hypothetical protein